MKLWLGRGLEAQRKAGGDQNDGFASLRQRLIEQALRVTERARQDIVGHDPAANLVRDENHRTFKLMDDVREVLCRA